MKTINFRNRSLSRDQFNLVSWLGTFVYNHYIIDRLKDQYNDGKLQGIESSCIIAGIDDLLVYDIMINLNLSGLRNYNKMTEIIYFE